MASKFGALTCPKCLDVVQQARASAAEAAARPPKSPAEQSAVVVFRFWTIFGYAEDSDAVMVEARRNGDDSTMSGLLAGFHRLLERTGHRPRDGAAAAALFLIYVGRLSDEPVVTDVPWTMTTQLLGLTLYPDNLFYFELDPNGQKPPSIYRKEL